MLEALNLFDISETPEFSSNDYDWHLISSLTDHANDADEMTVGKPLNIVAWQIRKNGITQANVFQSKETNDIFYEFDNLENGLYLIDCMRVVMEQSGELCVPPNREQRINRTIR